MAEPSALKEPTLVSIRADVAARLTRTNRRGDEDVAAMLAGMWPPSATCFLCDADADAEDGGWLSLPDYANAGLTIFAPLCAACVALPGQVRLRRAGRVAVAMWGHRARLGGAPWWNRR
jgi:hypothetical protein